MNKKLKAKIKYFKFINSKTYIYIHIYKEKYIFEFFDLVISI